MEELKEKALNLIEDLIGVQIQTGFDYSEQTQRVVELLRYIMNLQ